MSNILQSSDASGPVVEEAPDDGKAPEQRAFIRSAFYEFDGIQLQPYSALRDNAAFAMGYRGGVVGDSDMLEMATTVEVAVTEPVLDAEGNPMLDGEGNPMFKPVFDNIGGEQVARTEQVEKSVQIYKQLTQDVQIIIWLCLQPDSTCFKALRKPDWAFLEAMKWADREKVRWGMPRLAIAAKTFAEIMEDRNASYAVPEPEPGASRKAEPGN